MSFTNKIVLIIGGSDGIGAAAAVQFAQEGADVAIVGRNETRLANVSNNIVKTGKRALAIKADLTKDDEVRTLVQKTVEKFGKLDVLVNSAALMSAGSLLDGKAVEAYDKVFDTNVRGIIHVTMLAAPYLIKTKGNVVNISGCGSIDVFGNKPLMSFYVSEAARDHFTKHAALELAKHGVRVNAINPGPVKTNLFFNAGAPELHISQDGLKDFTTLGRVSEPEDIGNLILFIASDKAKGMTGSIVFADDGTLRYRHLGANIVHRKGGRKRAPFD